MRKVDVINKIANDTGIPKVDVLVSLETFFDTVKETLSNGESIHIRGFGSFIVKKKAKRLRSWRAGRRRSARRKWVSPGGLGSTRAARADPKADRRNSVRWAKPDTTVPSSFEGKSMQDSARASRQIPQRDGATSPANSRTARPPPCRPSDR